MNFLAGDTWPDFPRWMLSEIKIPILRVRETLIETTRPVYITSANLSKLDLKRGNFQHGLHNKPTHAHLYRIVSQYFVISMFPLITSTRYFFYAEMNDWTIAARVASNRVSGRDPCAISSRSWRCCATYRQYPSVISTGLRGSTLRTSPCTDHLDPPLSLTLLPALLALAKSRAGSQTYLSILRVDPASLPSPFSRFSLFNLRDYIASRSITNIRREKFVVDRFYDADRR